MTDFTMNGSCSRCGACCGDILPMEANEIRSIRRYVRKHHIKPVENKVPMPTPLFDLSCPFRDEAKKECRIYEVRPWICRQFICCQKDDVIERNRSLATQRGVHVSLWHEIFDDDRNQVVAGTTQMMIRLGINSHTGLLADEFGCSNNK